MPARLRGDAGLTRAERIRKRSDFVRIQNAPGARARGPGFLVLIQLRALHPDRGAAADAPDVSRIGVVASRRVGNAIRRNRAKRLLRELFRLHKAEFPTGCDLVFVAHTELPDKTLGELEAALPGVLAEVGRRARALARQPDRSQGP